MVSQRVKEQLIIELVLLAVTILATGVYLWIMLPRWKKELLIQEAVKHIQESTVTMQNSLSGKQELLVQEFKQMVSAWDHAQLQKFRKKMTHERLQESQQEPTAETAGDNPA